MRWARVGVEKCIKFSIRLGTLVDSGGLDEDVVGLNELRI
jgi:hypothetical protein